MLYVVDGYFLNACDGITITVVTELHMHVIPSQIVVFHQNKLGDDDSRCYIMPADWT